MTKYVSPVFVHPEKLPTTIQYNGQPVTVTLENYTSDPILDEDGYPIHTYHPEGKPAGEHGPLDIGYGCFPHGNKVTPRLIRECREEVARLWELHYASCNQCRKARGLPFNPHSAWPAS